MELTMDMFPKATTANTGGGTPAPPTTAVAPSFSPNPAPHAPGSSAPILSGAAVSAPPLVSAGAVGGGPSPSAPPPSAPPAAPSPAAVPRPHRDEPPPPYTTLPHLPHPRTPSEAPPPGWNGSPFLAASLASTTWASQKLGYMDFVPRVVKKRVFKEDEYENFQALITRANSWLEEHSGLKVISCETVTWMGMRTKSIYTDTCTFCKSKSATKQTKYLIGLRVWYFADIFPNPAARAEPQILRVKTFVPLKEERFDQLLTRTNDFLQKETMGGQILSVETVRMKCCQIEGDYSSRQVYPDMTFVKEYPDDTKRYAFCIRVYALFGRPINGVESIAYKDFVPEHNRQCQENNGYEVFANVMDKASNWVARQQGVRFCNVATVMVKSKKKGPFEERCVFIEHICANNRCNVFKGPNKKTPYLRIIRVFYVVTSRAPRIDYPPVRLTYRTFSPAQISAATADSVAEFEGMRQVVDRINQWLQLTGAKVFTVDTLPIRMTTGGLQLLGPEATYAANTCERQWTEKWLFHIRVFLDGEYIEPPNALSLVAPPMSVITQQP